MKKILNNVMRRHGTWRVSCINVWKKK